MSSVRPLFLVSLPRSGSTVIQRVLAHHPQIATASETWLLMPYLASTPQAPARPRGKWDEMASDAIGDFIRELHDARNSYREAIHDLAVHLYSQAAEENSTYFLDKAPPYSLFVPELTRTFPEAKFIALWRNPLAVVASIVETLCNGNWEADRYPVSLFASLEALVDSSQQYPDRVWSVRYEDLVSADADAWGGLASFLEIEIEPIALERFSSVALTGRLGDKTGIQDYPQLSKEPLEKWKRTIDTPVRKAWCRRYLEWIGPERLAAMGYDYVELEAELASTPVGVAGLAGDSVRVAGAAMRRAVRTRLDRAAVERTAKAGGGA